MDILNDIRAEAEQSTPFEAAQERADMFAVNMFLANAMNTCIENHVSGSADPDFDQKMILAGKTLEAMNVSA